MVETGGQDWTEVDSSMIQAVRFEIEPGAPRGFLYVKWRPSFEVGAYSNVSLAWFASFMEAESKGRFIQSVKDNPQIHEYTLLEPGRPKMGVAAIRNTAPMSWELALTCGHSIFLTAKGKPRRTHDYCPEGCA